MPILHTHWLWFFGAGALGVVLGWLTYRRDTPRWTVRPAHIAIAVVGLGVLLAVAKLVPSRYGYRLELGVIVAACCGVGCFVGWAMRDLAEYMPAAGRPGAAASTSGSYLFREAHAGLGTGSAYMRTTTADGALPRERLPLVTGPLTPAPGGYTFPRTLPFADATTSRTAAPVAGRRGHWSWPRPAGAAPYVFSEFAGAKGGYVFPAAAPASPYPDRPREGATRGGQYKHWSWRAAGAPDTLATSAPAAKPGAPSPAATASAAADRVSPAPDSKAASGTYVFPVAAAVAPLAARDGRTRAGQYRHWSGRDLAGPPAGKRAEKSTAPVTSVPEAAEVPRAPIAAVPEPDRAVAVSPAAATDGVPDSAMPAAPAKSFPAASVAEATGLPALPAAAGGGAVPATPVSGPQAPAPSGAAATGVVDGGRTIQTSEANPLPPASSAPGDVVAGEGALPIVPALPSVGGDAAALADALPTSPAGLPTSAAVAPGQPAVIAAVPGEEKHAGARPEGLMRARDDRADDLKRIRGIGPQNEGRLHGLGIWHFDQIGAWTPDNVRWVGSYLAFPGRIDRERWVEQAQLLAGGGMVAPRKPR